MDPSLLLGLDFDGTLARLPVEIEALRGTCRDLALARGFSSTGALSVNTR